MELCCEKEGNHYFEIPDVCEYGFSAESKETRTNLEENS